MLYAIVIISALMVKFWKEILNISQVSKYTHQSTHCLKYYSETLLFLPLSRIYKSALVVRKQFSCVELFDLNMAWLHGEVKSN